MSTKVTGLSSKINSQQVIWLRALKLFVLFGVPALGFLYSYQFLDQDRTEVIVPFRSFKAPTLEFQRPGDLEAKATIKLTEPLTVVNFLATWCPPCVEEFPAMIELQRQLKSKGVNLVFVSVDDTWENVDRFFKANQISVASENLFWDPTKAGAALWGSVKFPETYVVRRDAWVVERIVGLQQWTRPVVLKYFSDLSEKFSRLVPGPSAALEFKYLESLDLLFPHAQAETAKAPAVSGAGKKASPMTAPKVASKTEKGAGGSQQTKTSDAGVGALAPILHEEDIKNLERLRANIETANQNLQRVGGALKEERRNSSEQAIILQRRNKDLQGADAEVAKINKRIGEQRTSVMKAEESTRTELSEKTRIDREIVSLQERLAELQKRVEGIRDELTQAGKGLNTRIQNIETLEKAKENLNEELKSLGEKLDQAEEEQKVRRKAVKESDLELGVRQSKVKALEDQNKDAEASLADQKAKLVEFEKLLKK